MIRLLNHPSIWVVCLTCTLGLKIGLAQVQPIVKTEITPEQVEIGQKATMRVSLLVPTWFPKPPQFPQFDLANVITRLPPNSSNPISEQVNGETWSGISRRYEIVPMAGGQFSYPESTIQIQYANPETSQPVNSQVTIPEVSFTAALPPGAEGLDPYVGGKSLKLEQVVEGDISALEAGDGISIKYTAILDGMPSLFIPPISVAIALVGVSMYSDEPVLTDEELATRVERVTLVFESSGNYKIPGLSMDWWNSESKSIATATTEPILISVKSGATAENVTSRVSDISKQFSWKTVLSGMVLFGLFGWFVYKYRPVFIKWTKDKMRHYRLSERYAYEQLQTAIKSKDLKRTYITLQDWRDRIPDQADRMLQIDLSRKLESVSNRLGRALFSDKSAQVEFSELAGEIISIKKSLSNRTSVAPALPVLNP